MGWVAAPRYMAITNRGFLGASLVPLLKGVTLGELGEPHPQAGDDMCKLGDVPGEPSE